MSLSLEDRLYVSKRERLVGSWPIAGAILLLLLAAFAVWLWFMVPTLINPWAVLDSLETNTLQTSTACTMAALLPVVVLVLLVSAFAFVLFIFIAMSNERRVLGLVRKLEQASGGSP